jgi:gluconate 5-dehydrogenase
MTPHELKGKVALVTGASKGLGREIAVALAGAGADLILMSRDLEKLEETARLARASGVQVRAHRGNNRQRDRRPAYFSEQCRH